MKVASCCTQASGVTAIEKITSKLSDTRRKKLEEMIQSSKQSGRAPAATAAPAAPKPGPSRPSAPKKASVRSSSPESNDGGSEVTVPLIYMCQQQIKHTPAILPILCIVKSLEKVACVALNNYLTLFWITCDGLKAMPKYKVPIAPCLE